jgi:hypothetical protein
VFRRPRGNYRNIPPRKGGSAGPPPVVPINFADLFPGAYQVVQSDLGLSYGAVMRADAGNTSSVAFALTGATPAVPVPIWIRVTAPGVGNVYYDGLGVTPAMVGVTIVDSVNIVLTGAGLGMAITPGVGSQVVGNTWRATCSGLADQSGNAKHYSQLTPSQQPIVTAGLNGKPGLLFDGVNDVLVSTISVPYPFLVLFVGRIVGPSGLPGMFGGGNPYQGSIINNPTTVQQYSGAGFVNTVAFSALTNQRFAALFSNSAADSLRIGNLPPTTGANAGAAISTQMGIGSLADVIRSSNVEVFAVLIVPPTDYSAFDAALNSPQGYAAGAIIV